MKRKNILKFVSLLGIGSFVMLAAASCTKTTTATPNPNTPSNGGGMTDNMSGGNTNPDSNQGAMNAAAKELSDAKAALMTLLSNKSNKIGLYSDYAKIQNTLTAAYTSAEVILENQSATLEQVKNATSTLQTAISTADINKQKFDQNHSDLLTQYKNLKITIAKKETIIMGLKNSKYSAILNHIDSASSKGEDLIQQTLDPVSGGVPATNTITEEITKIENVISESALKKWKDNANEFANYKSFTLNKTKLVNMDETRKMVQPGNWSFAGYSVDVTGTTGQEHAIPNWNYAHRTIFDLMDKPISNSASEGMAQPLSNVSWIYSLTGADSKYTLEFTYYGPSTGYLYFPYKLVKRSDSDKVALQYKLNDASQATAITFGAGETTNRKTPTVDDINVAKVTLANLKFGSNKIEFSVPDSKVNPMIGNMYLTSVDAEANKSSIENSIFGNSITTETNETKISVDPLSSYSLASDWSTVVYEYSSDSAASGNSVTLDGQNISDKKYYLNGWVGGHNNESSGSGKGFRNLNPITGIMNQQKLPIANSGSTRTYTFYVNAPKEGQYYIKGIFTGGDNSKLKFTTGTHDLTITNLMSKHNHLKTFNTSAESGDGSNTEGSKKTLTLAKGLNKIVVNGADGGAPNFGHFEFILKETQSENTPTPDSTQQ